MVTREVFEPRMRKGKDADYTGKRFQTASFLMPSERRLFRPT
ncbi:hypothetical protein NEICINOT_03976 [Neisseria cinerea ATCC 14685]|uniref:Uncharacterized protein n=1 Tax=Neisseria cinerea ATCC 14685 TaxID=546262 RepID=D0W2U1_NEICI|nr:hypothetical protein NEICINOT_03976 [Neisseria cinerea ATCC 14685]